MPTVAAASRTDAGLANELRSSLMRLARRLRQERTLDLSPTAMSVLGQLMRHGETTIGSLAAHERVKPPSMTRTVNCLEADGLVTRRPSETDGRQVLVAISEEGRARVLADRKRREAWLAQRLGDLTPEDRAALRTVAPILDRLAGAE